MIKFKVITLLDTGATHNFVNEGLMSRSGLQMKEFERFRVWQMDLFTCIKRILNLPLRLNDYEFQAD